MIEAGSDRQIPSGKRQTLQATLDKLVISVFETFWCFHFTIVEGTASSSPDWFKGDKYFHKIRCCLLRSYLPYQRRQLHHSIGFDNVQDGPALHSLRSEYHVKGSFICRHVCNPNLEIVLDYLNRSFHYSYIVSKYIDRSDLRKMSERNLKIKSSI